MTQIKRTSKINNLFSHQVFAREVTYRNETFIEGEEVTLKGFPNFKGRAFIYKFIESSHYSKTQLKEVKVKTGPTSEFGTIISVKMNQIKKLKKV